MALNPHLLQRLAQDNDLSSQLMKFNSELTGLGCNSNGSLSGATDKQPMILHSNAPSLSLSATPMSYEANNSCDNSQEAHHSKRWIFM